LLALTVMDVFTDSELFDDDTSCTPLPATDEATDPLTVSSGTASPRPRGEDSPRRAAYVLAALAMLVVAVIAFHTGGSSPGLHPSHVVVRRRHARSRERHPRERVTQHRAAARKAQAPIVATKVVVAVPSSRPERPTGTESVGNGRPTRPPSVGNTEQFGYLGR
jgi:hypothetical protein